MPVAHIHLSAVVLNRESAWCDTCLLSTLQRVTLAWSIDDVPHHVAILGYCHGCQQQT